MNNKRVIILCVLFFILFPNLVLSDERKIIFNGFNSKLEEIIDSMTDKKEGIIFVDFGNIYIAIYNYNDFCIWPSSNNNIIFAEDATNLIRINDSQPFKLDVLKKKNALTMINKTESEQVIKSLLKGEEIKIRYYNWPDYDKIDKTISNKNLGFIYAKAIHLWKWKDLGISDKIAPAKLNIYKPDKEESAGYAEVTVIDNGELGIRKGFDKYKGGTHITVGILETFGITQGEWTVFNTIGNPKIIIRDENNKIVFEETIISKIGRTKYLTSDPWNSGFIVAKHCWNVGDLGSIEITGDYGKKVLLYGFKTLWKWGIDNAGFPVLE